MTQNELEHLIASPRNVFFVVVRIYSDNTYSLYDRIFEQRMENEREREQIEMRAFFSVQIGNIEFNYFQVAMLLCFFFDNN